MPDVVNFIDEVDESDVCACFRVWPDFQFIRRVCRSMCVCLYILLRVATAGILHQYFKTSRPHYAQQALSNLAS